MEKDVCLWTNVAYGSLSFGLHSSLSSFRSSIIKHGGITYQVRTSRRTELLRKSPEASLCTQTLSPRASDIHKHTTAARKDIPVLAIRCRFAARALSARRSSPRSPSLHKISHVSRRCHKSHEPRERLNTWPKKSRMPGPAAARQLLATARLSARVFYQSASTVPCCIHLVWPLTRSTRTAMPMQ